MSIAANMNLASAVNFIMGSLTVFAQVLIVWLVFSWLFGWKLPEFVRAHALSLAFCAALIATLGSLTYSDIVGFAPCKLCWFERIFMYPQVLILGFALWGKHKGVRALLDVSFTLSILGALLSLYHHLMQLNLVPAGSCAAIGYSVSCAKVFVMQFDYITIPLMAFSAFLLIIVSLLLTRVKSIS